MALMRWGVVLLSRAGMRGGAGEGEEVSRGAMVRGGAVLCGPATSQHGATALVLAASEGHIDAVELLLDRGADLEAKHEVSAAAVCD